MQVVAVLAVVFIGQKSFSQLLESCASPGVPVTPDACYQGACYLDACYNAQPVVLR